MPINTLETPKSIQPLFKPKFEELEPQLESQEKYPYGWRYVTKTLPGGQEIYYKKPLTLEDSLNPQEDDEVPQRSKHAQCSIDIFDMLRNRYAFSPTVGVFYDLIMKWGVDGLDEPAPDVIVIPNIRDKYIDCGHFDVKQQGTRPSLIIEVVSPSSQTDYTRKVETYQQAGVQEYFIIDPHSKTKKPSYEIKAYRLQGNKYMPIKPDEQGCFLSKTTDVLFGVYDNKQRVRLKDSKTGEWLLTAPEEQEARLAEQEARLAEQEARLAEQEVRLKAEAQVKQGEQKIHQLMEQLRQLGVEPK